MDAPILQSRLPQYSSGWRQWKTQLLQRLHRWRNALLLSPEFHRRIVQVPFGAAIARRRATELHNITAGFVYSQTLSACVSLRLFHHLRQGPIALSTLSSLCQLPSAGLERLLLAARSLRLVEYYEDGRWGLGELGAAMEANPGIAAMVEHHQHLYRDLMDPVALLQGRGPTHLSAYWPYARQQNEGDTQAYSQLMSVSQQLIADTILNALTLPKSGHWLDVAGGEGAFAQALLARNRALTATVFDLIPSSTEAAGSVSCTTDTDTGTNTSRLIDIDAPDTGNTQNTRLQFIHGDMFTDPLPTNATVISLIRILHDHDDDRVRALLKRVHDALDQDGTLVIAEPMAQTPGAEAIGDAYFGLYLWAMGSGRPRTAAEITLFLQEAGFCSVTEQRSAMPCLVRVITACRSESNV